jgi:hypothetical protein
MHVCRAWGRRELHVGAGSPPRPQVEREGKRTEHVGEEIWNVVAGNHIMLIVLAGCGRHI